MLRRLLPLVVLAACAPGKFDAFVGPAGAAAEDGGVLLPVADAQVQALDGSLDAARASMDAGAPSADARSDDGPAWVLDAAAPTRDECGQVHPIPGQFAIAQSGVAMLDSIALSALAQPRYPTGLASVGDDYWWMFSSAFAPGTALVSSTDSITRSTKALPYVLAETSSTSAPASFIPALQADRDALMAGEQLLHRTGNIMMTGPTDGVVFYAPTALGYKDGALYQRNFGTRMATLHFEGGTAQASAGSALVFGADEPAFRYGTIADGYLYLYGCVLNFAAYDCMVARAPQQRAGDASSYEFRTATGWSSDITLAATVLDRARDDLSISYNPFLHSYLAVHMFGAASEIYLRTAPAPDGPWSALGSITLPAPLNRDVPHAGAMEHPTLATQCGRKLVLTYMFSKNVSDNELRRIEVTLREGTAP